MSLIFHFKHRLRQRFLRFNSTLTAFLFFISASLVVTPQELFAAPGVEAPVALPSSIQAGSPVDLLVTVRVQRTQADPVVVPGGAYLMRVTQSGTMIGNFGAMRDDGLEGDAVAGDDILTLRIHLDEAPQDGLRLRASVAFERVVRRATSPITVVPVVDENQAPLFTSEPLTEARQDFIYYYQAEAEDPEGGEVALELVDGPRDLIMTESGFLRWTPREYQVGDQQVVLKATDPQGKAAMQLFTIIVTPFNHPPVITSLPQRQVTSGEEYSYDIEAFDKEGSALVFSIDQGPQDMSIDPNTGQLIWPVPSDAVGQEEVTVRVTDAGNEFALQTFTIDLITEPLDLISPSGEFEVFAGETLELTLEANYEQAGFRVTPMPDNATLPFTSKVFKFTPTLDQVGLHNLGFEAVFAKMRDVNPILINVKKRNTPPVLNEISPQTTSEGESLLIPVNAIDQDGDKLKYFLPNLSTPNVYFDEINQAIVFAPNFDQAGDHEILVRVSDGTDNDEKTVQINVLNVEATNAQSLDLVIDNLQNPNFRATIPITGSVTGEVRSQVYEPPVIVTGLSPAAVLQRREATIDITGLNTDFTADTTTIDFGTGITVDEFEVLSVTTARARITADSTADIGTRQVIVREDGTEILSAAVFNVEESASRITGILIDSFTKQPILGARVAINATTIIDHTNADGEFVLDGLPGGEHTIVATTPNYEVMRLDITLDQNVPLDLGKIEVNALARPFNAGGSIPRAASLASVIDRGLSTQDFDLTLEQAKALILDAILAIPGTDYGAYDEAGNQLNPNLQGAGPLSLTPQGISQHALALLEGDVFTLSDVIDAIYGSFSWALSENFTREALVDSLQAAVNEAWANPGNPYNVMPIMIFNEGTTLQSNAPLITMSTRLNHFQCFLLVSSFLKHFGPDLDLAYKHVYETNGVSMPEIELDLNTLERVVTVHGQEIRSGAPGIETGGAGQAVSLAAAGVSKALLGGLVYADDADPNDVRDKPEESAAANLWKKVKAEAVLVAKIAAITTAIVILGAFLLGVATGAATLGGAGAIMAAIALGTAIGWAASAFVRATSSYFGPQAVNSLKPPAPSGIVYREADDVRKFFIEFEKSPIHVEKDATGHSDRPLFVPFTTLVDLFGPTVNLSLVEFEYQLWKVKSRSTPLSDKANTRLISTNAVQGFTQVSSNRSGGLEHTEHMRFVLPIEKLDQGENIFKIRTVMFYRGYIYAGVDKETSSRVSLADLGIAPPQEALDLGYKDGLSLATSTTGASDAQVNALKQQLQDSIDNFINAVDRDDAIQASEDPLGLKARQKIVQNYLDVETNAFEQHAGFLEFAEREAARRFIVATKLVDAHLELSGTSITDITNPASPVNHEIVQAIGGQAQYDGIKTELEDYAKASEKFAKSEELYNLRKDKLTKIKDTKTFVEDAIVKARSQNRAQVVDIVYDVTDLVTPENPAPRPQTVSRKIAFLPDGSAVRVDTPVHTITTAEAELSKVKADLDVQQFNYNKTQPTYEENLQVKENRAKLLQDKFVLADRLDEAHTNVKTSNEKVRVLTESRDRIKQQVEYAKQAQESAIERAAARENFNELAELELKVDKNWATRLANNRAVRFVSSPQGNATLAAVTAIPDTAWNIREGIALLPSPFSEPYVLVREGDNIRQFGPASPPTPPGFGPDSAPDTGLPPTGPLPKVRKVITEAFGHFNFFSLPLAFAQVPQYVIPPYFETDPDEKNQLGFLRTLADSNNPKGGFLARQFPFTTPHSSIASAGFPSDYIATDSTGAVYLLNGNSYSNFGGRVFRYKGSPASREHIGMINYYSQLLGYARAVRPIAIEVGEFKDSTYGMVENLFIANREEGIPLLSGGTPPPNRILRLPTHLADLHPAYANGQNRNRIVAQPYAEHPDFRFSGPSDMERDIRPRDKDSDPPRPVYFSDEENIFALVQRDGEDRADVIKIISIPGRRWSGLAQDIIGNFFFADYNSGEVFLLPANELDNIVNGNNGIIGSDSELDFRAYLIKVGIDRPGDIELDTLQERYVVSTPNGFEPFDIVLIGRYASGISSIVSDVLGQEAPVTLRPDRGNVFIVGKPTEGENARKVRLRIRRRDAASGRNYWSEEAMHLEEFGATIYEGTLS